MRGTSLAALFVTAIAHAQNKPPAAVEWLLAHELQPRLDQARTWLPLLSRPTLSLGRYRLPKGGTDGQQPHDRDEVYQVLRGAAKFTADGTTRDVVAGDVVFVAAGAAHHFHDITEDLDLLVFFSDARPSGGGMVAGPVPSEQTPYPETSARGATRIFYWFGLDSAGQVHIDHGQPRWNPAYEKFLNAPAKSRWRCGENFWTTLDTNIDLVIGGTEVPIGLYYVVLQHLAERGPELVLLDAQQVRRQRLDAYEAGKTSGGLVVPLRHEQAPVAASRLQFELTVDRAQRDRGELQLRFGPHLLRADVLMKPAR
ncbi:MAG: cupin domain-containing protein [Planctomycetes bacterium]|nr:cupin domain-containing protein [Planctomycetota bacterium]